MIDLRELYQEVIIDHGRRPRNFCACANASHVKEGYNPLCGDQLTIYIIEKSRVIEKIVFEGQGCAISIASASIMTEALKGKTIADAKQLFEDFHTLLTRNNQEGNQENVLKKVGKLAVLVGVAKFPARVKCATLAWHTMLAALNNSKETVSTE